MTDKEILKALEEELKTALIINHRFEESNDTENPDDHRFIALLSRTIDLINRQQAEIVRLKIENQSLRAAANSYKIHYDKARTEAVKEFAESLCKDRVSNDPVVIAVQIELKEWLGDTE